MDEDTEVRYLLRTVTNSSHTILTTVIMWKNLVEKLLKLPPSLG